jgi:hypothetical protein
MSPETAVPALSFKSSLLEVNAIGPYAITALVVLVVLWFVGRLLLQYFRS